MQASLEMLLRLVAKLRQRGLAIEPGTSYSV
ncbi:hypothetical protein NK6_2613 [Bradyrhizobium diazoefficiens]|uniref:Uncharacterized protein n=1 Tax=Bradyrhizobium diazoefficiens TaxID=1355477 RepID=A0A0E4BN87_9BRAD|nr:hypothetical protein NK6_2613 [Bradyrhizobium diazoefficiens]